MKSVNLYGVVIGTIIMASCVNHKMEILKAYVATAWMGRQ